MRILRPFIFTLVILISACASSRPSLQCVVDHPIPQIKNGNVLVVVAHQDDEVFIVTRLRQHILSGDSIYLLWTAASYQGDSEYAETRVTESLHAMERLGVKSSNCSFLKFPDGQTHKHVKEIIHRISILINDVRPKTIYVPAFEGGHIDHDIANFAVAKAINDLDYTVEIYEFPLYSAYNTPRILPFTMRSFPSTLSTECRVLDDVGYQFVLDFWNQYPSQHFPLGWYLAIRPGQFRTFGIEYLRPMKWHNYLQTPSEGAVGYERFLKVKFQDFREAVGDLNLLPKED
jgi:hypothetical protein